MARSEPARIRSNAHKKEAQPYRLTVIRLFFLVLIAPAWEQRKLGELYQKNDERNTDGLGSERTLSVASMTFNSAGNGADDSSLPNYKRLRLGDIAFEGHTNKEFAYGRFVLNDAGNGIMSPRFTCLRPIVEQEYSFWKYFIHSEKVMRPILVNSTKSGTMMNELVVEDFLKQEILVPSLPEQRRIGAFFDRLDSLITLHQRKYCGVASWMLGVALVRLGSESDGAFGEMKHVLQ
jgi:restriction endonuclease S subunit